MGNRFITIILVAIIGILIGVGVVSKQSKDTSLNQILEKQDQLLANVQNGGTANLAEVLAQQKVLAEKIGKLETELAAMKNNAAPAAPPAPPSEDFAKAYDIPVGQSYISGPKDAPVTIVEFMDFECPFCSRFHQPVVDVLAAYPDKVNYIIKNFPLSFHPNARPAAKAALAAGLQGKYYEMAHKILENARELGDATYERIAGEIGLNVEQFKKDLKEKDAAFEEVIAKDMALAETVDVRGTPTFYLNGKKTMARDLPRFKQEIDAILAK